jgi:hypothetical protein
MAYLWNRPATARCIFLRNTSSVSDLRCRGFPSARQGRITRPRPLGLRADKGRDFLRSYNGIVVLPEAKDTPPSLREASVGIRVPHAVRLELLLPPLAVLLWGRAVNGAVVPVASIDVDSDPRSPKDDVRPSPRPVHGAIDHETQTTPVELRPEDPLRLGVTAFRRAHSLTYQRT